MYFIFVLIKNFKPHLNKIQATGGKALTKWLKFDKNSRHLPHPKKGLYKDIKRESKNINFDFHFIHGEKSWLKVKVISNNKIK